MKFKITKKVFFLILAIFYSSFVFSFLALYLINPMAAKGSDLASFIVGAGMVKTGKGKEIYDENTQLFYQRKIIDPSIRPWLLPFRSPPIVAELFVPLSYLGLNSAYAIFLLVNLIILFLINYIALKIFPKAGKLYLVFLMTLIFWPVISVFEMGQFTLLLVLAFLLIYKYAKEKNIFLAGLISGILLIKPQYFIFVPFLFFLIKEKMQFIKGFLISSILIILVNISISGFGQLLKYPSFLIGTEAVNYGSRPFQMFTLYGLLKNTPVLAGIPNWFLLCLNFILYLVALFLFAKKIGKLSLNKGFAVGIVFTILFSVHALVHDLSILLIPIFILLDTAFSEKDTRIGYSKLLIPVLFFLPLIILTNNTFPAVVLLLLIGCYLLFLPCSLNLDYQNSITPKNHK